MSENEGLNEELEEKFHQEFREEAIRRGIDPDLFTQDAVQTKRVGRTIHVGWKGVGVDVPAPSPEAWDAWFDRYGGVVVGAVIALAGVVVGRGKLPGPRRVG